MNAERVQAYRVTDWFHRGWQRARLRYVPTREPVSLRALLTNARFRYCDYRKRRAAARREVSARELMSGPAGEEVSR